MHMDVFERRIVQTYIQEEICYACSGLGYVRTNIVQYMKYLLLRSYKVMILPFFFFFCNLHFNLTCVFETFDFLMTTTSLEIPHEANLVLGRYYLSIYDYKETMCPLNALTPNSYEHTKTTLATFFHMHYIRLIRTRVQLKSRDSLRLCSKTCLKNITKLDNIKLNV